MKSRPARVGEKLITHHFGTGTRGFMPVGDPTTAVCVLPGTELAFTDDVKSTNRPEVVGRTAIFRQVNKDQPCVHHDALEFSSGVIALLTHLNEGQEATVLQMPADPKTLAEREAQERVPVQA